MIVIDDTYGFEKKSRIYNEYSPTLRRERSGLKVMIDVSNTQKNENGILFPQKDIVEEIKNDEEEVEFSNMAYRIRKLTPKECWRLMGFSDEDFEKAQSAGISNTQLYKQAGNSIVTDVLYYIFKELYNAMPYLFDDLKVGSYFSGIGAFEVGLDRLYADINNENFIQQQTV